VVKRLTVRDLGTVLGVWAHPDDEAYLSAGLMATARDFGQRVVVATATAGDATDPDGDGVLRRKEISASLASVDVREHHWLGYVDGHCADVPDEAGAATVLRLLQRVQPDTVLTFGADGITGHPDHIAVGRWVAQAWNEDGRRAVLMQATLTRDFHRRWGKLSAAHGVWMPGAVPPAVDEAAVSLQVAASGSIAQRKMAALCAHASQTRGLRRAVGDDTYRQWWANESFVRVTAPHPAAA
jgi:LmbE family N-acetylglucosaminyl deacetylase